jgi:carboxylesterase
MTIAMLAVVVAMAVALSRVRTTRRARAAIDAMRQRETNANGVLVGAESIRLDAPGDRGVLILHGFNDTPQSVAELAHALHRRGWSVSAPLLPSHGRRDDALEREGSAERWVAFARNEWQAFRARTPRAALCGQSMGGAIAVVLAAEAPPPALVLLAPYLTMSRVIQSASMLWPLWQVAVPLLISDPQRGFRDRSARAASLGRGFFTPRVVAQLRRVVVRARRALPHVTSPTLVIHARGDYRIPSKRAQDAFAQLGAADKALVWRDDSGHVLAADAGRHDVARIAAEWLDAKIPSGVPK